MTPQPHPANRITAPPEPKNILAIDTASERLALALVAGQARPHSIYDVRGREISRVLFSEINKLLCWADIKPRELNLMLVAVGPGSFTGTRIGMAVAATFSQVLDCPLIGVDTLSLLAAQVDPAETGTFHALLNCVRNEIYHAPFRWHAGRLEPLAPVELTTVLELPRIVGGESVVLRRFQPEALQWAGPLGELKRAPLLHPHPDGERLIEMGLARWRDNPQGPFPMPVPIYLKSEAFRKWRPNPS